MLTVAEFLRQIPRDALEARAKESTIRARAALMDGLEAVHGVDIAVFCASLMKVYSTIEASPIANGIKNEDDQIRGLTAIFSIVGMLAISCAMNQLQLDQDDPPPTRQPVDIDRMRPGKN